MNLRIRHKLCHARFYLVSEITFDSIVDDFSFLSSIRLDPFTHHSDDDDDESVKRKNFLGGNRELSFLIFRATRRGRTSRVKRARNCDANCKRRAHIRAHAWKTTTGKGGVCVCTIHNAASTFDLVRSKVTSTMAAY